jgi:nucleotide-binding universal stress UspA family protein
MIKRIMLATDGSAAAERAAATAASLARRYAAELIVVHAYLRVPSSQEEPRDAFVLYETYDEALALVQNVAARMRELGVADVHTDIKDGPSAEVILHFATVYRPDLLVIGARGRGVWQGLALGSVSMALVERAACPVLVVK